MGKSHKCITTRKDLLKWSLELWLGKVFITWIFRRFRTFVKLQVKLQAKMFLVRTGKDFTFCQVFTAACVSAKEISYLENDSEDSEYSFWHLALSSQNKDSR